jgi:hypothetical protein
MTRRTRREHQKDLWAWEAEQIRSDGRRCFGSFPGQFVPSECEVCWAKAPCFLKTIGAEDPFIFYGRRQGRWRFSTRRRKGDRSEKKRL